MKSSTQEAAMDGETAEHFYAWLAQHVHESEQHEVEQAIHALLREHRDLPGSRSWPEMRQMAGA